MGDQITALKPQRAHNIRIILQVGTSHTLWLIKLQHIGCDLIPYDHTPYTVVCVVVDQISIHKIGQPFFLLYDVGQYCNEENSMLFLQIHTLNCLQHQAVLLQHFSPKNWAFIKAYMPT